MDSEGSFYSVRLPFDLCDARVLRIDEVYRKVVEDADADADAHDTSSDGLSFADPVKCVP